MCVCVCLPTKEEDDDDGRRVLPACLPPGTFFSLRTLLYCRTTTISLLKKEGEGKERKVAAVYRSVQRTVIAIAAASGKRRMSKDADDKEEEDSGR